MDTSGNLYIADSNNHRVRKVSAAGIITTVAGNGTRGYSGDGGPATSAQLYDPQGVAVDTSGNLYIADRHNNRVRAIRLVTPSGRPPDPGRIISDFNADGFLDLVWQNDTTIPPKALRVRLMMN